MVGRGRPRRRPPTGSSPGEGALLTPAFVDAHVHATATGLALTGLDLHPSMSLRHARCVHRRARHGGAVRHGAGHRLGRDGWPEGRGLTRHDLDAVVGDRPAYLARVDVHSATVSTALLDRVPGITDLDGYAPDGRLRLDAHHAARRAAYGAVGADQRRAAQRAALDGRRPSASGACTRWPAPRCRAPTTSSRCSTLAASAPAPACWATGASSPNAVG